MERNIFDMSVEELKSLLLETAKQANGELNAACDEVSDGQITMDEYKAKAEHIQQEYGLKMAEINLQIRIKEH